MELDYLSHKMEDQSHLYVGRKTLYDSKLHLAWAYMQKFRNKDVSKWHQVPFCRQDLTDPLNFRASKTFSENYLPLKVHRRQFLRPN